MNRGRGTNKTTPPLVTGRTLGPGRGRQGGGSGREVVGGSQREERTPGQENPWADRDLGAG